MTAALIITLRETLEAALIVGILLAYLKKTTNQKHNRFIWFGVLAGILLSVVLASIFQNVYGGFEGRAEELYEGITMLIAAGLITWMILWMLTQRQKLRKNLEDKAQTHIERDYPIGLFFLSFIGVAREGIETVIFLQAALIQSDKVSVFGGGLLGIVLAVILSYLLFKGIAKIPLRKFFAVTSVLLILFAAGLTAHGLHELQEAKVVPVFSQEMWDINPAVVTEGVYPVLHEKGAIGGLLKGLFGYNGNPTLLEILSYGLYLVFIFGLWVGMERRALK